MNKLSRTMSFVWLMCSPFTSTTPGNWKRQETKSSPPHGLVWYCLHTYLWLVQWQITILLKDLPCGAPWLGSSDVQNGFHVSKKTLGLGFLNCSPPLTHGKLLLKVGGGRDFQKQILISSGERLLFKEGNKKIPHGITNVSLWSPALGFHLAPAFDLKPTTSLQMCKP